MAAAYDILLAADGDLRIDYGDLVTGESDQQHIEDTINAFPGWWKEHFTDGVGVLSYLNSSGRQQELARNVKIQLQQDGYTVQNPRTEIFDGKVEISPNAYRR